MLQITNLRAQTFDLDFIDLFWEAAPGADPLDYTFTVLKSYAEFSDFEAITRPFQDRYHFRDPSVVQRHFFRPIYYRIKVIRVADSATAIYPEMGRPGISLSARPDLEALEIARLTRLRLQEFEGRLVWVFPVRTFGQRCTRCFDTTTQMRTRGFCRTCYGASFVGGFHSPVQTYMSIVDVLQSAQPSDNAVFTTVNGSGKLANFPLVKDGDIVVESENIRWRVNGVRQTQKLRAIIRQDFGLHRIATDDSAYTLPILVDNLGELQPTPERQYTNPQTLGWDQERHGYRE